MPMDVDLVSKIPIGPALGATTRTPAGDDGFAAAMTTRLDDGASIVERAERRIGTRIRAPEGGCSCDAFVGSVAPSAPAASPNGSLAPGRVLTLNDPNDLSGHLHRAILRNATEMITAARSGLVEVLTVPWDRVEQT